MTEIRVVAGRVLGYCRPIPCKDCLKYNALCQLEQSTSEFRFEMELFRTKSGSKVNLGDFLTWLIRDNSGNAHIEERGVRSVMSRVATTVSGCERGKF